MVVSPDPVLAVVSSIGLACVAASALVVDFGLKHPTARRTLADLVAEGPNRSELSPGHPGIAVMPAGPIDEGESVEILEVLAASWPALVVRHADPTPLPLPSVPVRPLYPGMEMESTTAVWQPTSLLSTPPGPGPVLPLLGRGLVNRVLQGRHPGRGRWIKAWREVWDLPWA